MKLHFRQIGDSGKPLVVLHGLFGSSDNWQTLGKRFAEDHRVFLVDQRNHGRSPHTEEFSYELMANDLRIFIEDQGLDDVILLGHSMGGKTAMLFAEKYPDYLDKLIVADIAPKAYPPHHDVILKALNETDIEGAASRSEIQRQMQEHIQDPVVIQFLMKNLYRKDKETFAWRINIPTLTRSMPEILREFDALSVDIPSRFIRGDRSNYILDADFDRIKSQFPWSEIKTIEGAGHWVHAEAPDKFYQLVKEFSD